MFSSTGLIFEENLRRRGAYLFVRLGDAGAKILVVTLQPGGRFSGRARGAVLYARHAVALDHHLTHPPAAQAFVVVTGLDRAGPKKHQGHVGGVDGAVRPEGRDIRDLARREFRRAGRAVLPFEQDKSVA
jgi:hypothetical protein